jgi:UDP-2,3-diacylglucosamine pyrophosphatase LpxH
MIQRTLIVSDLHLGNGGDFDTFAGADALPALLAELGHEPLRVVLNGDTVDFLMNEDPLELDAERALGQAAAIFAAPASANHVYFSFLQGLEATVRPDCRRDHTAKDVSSYR